MTLEVELVAGPACCGKTQMLLRKYAAALQKKSDAGGSYPELGRCCWLAPNQPALAQLQGRLAAEEAVSFLQPNLFTFASYAESVIASSWRRIRPLSALQKRRLVGHAVEMAQHRQRFEHYGRVASAPGFHAQIDELISDLKRADIWPEDYQRWSAKRLRSDRGSRELAQIYAAYQQLLHEGELYDAEGRFWAARELLTEQISSASLQFDLVVVDGFNDFTVAQYDILRLLGQFSQRMAFGLTMGELDLADVDQHSWFSKTHQTFLRLREVFPDSQVTALQSEPAQQHTLMALQQELGRSGTEGVTHNKPQQTAWKYADVEILAASSEAGEIESVAQRIKALLQTDGAAPQEIVVVARGGDAMLTLVRAIFPDYGIPFYVEGRPRLEIEPLLRALNGLLRLHTDDWSFHTLLEVVGNRIFGRFDEANAESASYTSQPRVALEHCVRAAQLPSGKSSLVEQLEYWQEHARQPVVVSDETAARADYASVALSIVRLLNDALQLLPTQATIEEWTLVIENVLQRLGALPSSPNEPLAASIAWKLLKSGLHSLATVDAWSQRPSASISLSDLQELIAVVARQQRMPAQHDDVGRVRVLSAESARKLTVEHLFVAGIGEQSFSATAATNEVNTTEPGQTATNNLAELVGERTAQAESLSEGRLLFYELITRPTKSLTLSYPALDSKGQPLSPSPLLVEMQRVAGENRIAVTTIGLADGAHDHASIGSRSGLRRQAVEEALSGKQQWLAGMLTSSEFRSTAISVLSGIESVAERSGRNRFGAFEGLLLSPAAQGALARRFDGNHLWSPSQLESYATCPYRFFAEHLLHLEPINELVVRNDARRRGSLLHQVLATIHQELLDIDTSGASPEEADLVKRFLTALESAVSAVPLRGIAHALREIERREIEAWAPGYAEQETQYRRLWSELDEPPRPAYFEVRFGPESRSSTEEASRGSTALPFELDLGDERIRLTGQIDRVDVGRAGGMTVFNIIDYKSGRGVQLKLEKVRSGHQLQLPLYALATEQLLLAEHGAVALATGYWNVREKGFAKGRGALLRMREVAAEQLQTSDDWQQLQPEIFQQVQRLIRGMRSGWFPVYNEDEKCTQGCSLSTICRVSQIRSLEKVWSHEMPAADGDRGDS